MEHVVVELGLNLASLSYYFINHLESLRFGYIIRIRRPFIDTSYCSLERKVK